MDEFVEEKLQEWNLAELIPTFEAQQIGKESFVLLDEHSLASLIPLVGPRLKFQHNLKKLLEISQDSSGELTENWSPVFSQNIIRMTKKEKTTDILLDLEMAGKEGDIALLLLPVLLPTAPVGKKVSRPSSLESRAAFIDVKLPGTNMVEYLSRAAMESPHVLMLGEECECSQAFVILNGTALEQPSLLGAVDICFKAHYVFDLVYPKSCTQVWEFIQSVVYEMPGDVSNVVKFMKAQLNAVHK